MLDVARIQVDKSISALFFMDVSGGQQESVMFHPLQTLLKIFVRYHSFLLHVMLSVLFNRYRVKVFVRDTHRDRDREDKTTFRQAQIQTYKADRLQIGQKQYATER